MKERHLRLVVSQNFSCGKNCEKLPFFKKLKIVMNCILTPRAEKICILKSFLTRIYKDYEISTGYNSEPYFIRAENKLSNIIQQNKVDYYYLLVKKYKY